MAQYENLEGWEKLSLGMQLDKWAIRYGNRIAVTDSEEEITYSELNQKATQKEIAAIITHVAFYAGWPKGWAVFNLAKEVWNEDEAEK